MRFSDVLSSFIVSKCLNEAMAFYFAYFLKFLSCHYLFSGRFGKVNNAFAIEREQGILSSAFLFCNFQFSIKSLNVMGEEPENIENLESALGINLLLLTCTYEVSTNDHEICK